MINMPLIFQSNLSGSFFFFLEAPNLCLRQTVAPRRWIKPWHNEALLGLAFWPRPSPAGMAESGMGSEWGEHSQVMGSSLLHGRTS